MPAVSLLPPMRSVYRWQGAIEQADEVLLLAKTAADRTPALVSRLRELHPYELPEIVAVEAAGGTVIAASNIGCITQLSGATPLPVVHTV